MIRNKFESSRLFLESIIDRDIEFIFKGLSNPVVIKYYGVSYFSLESTKVQMKFYRDLVENESGEWWIIIDKNTKEPMGAIGLNNLDKNHKKAELGFWLLPEYWGKGYIQEAFLEIEHHAFNNLKLHRIEAYVETENTSSNKSLEKLNFKKEGTLRDVEFKNNRYLSLNIWSKLDNDR